jgi:hypothetical protein
LISRLSRRAVQLGMGFALLCAALLFLASNLNWAPGGGDALGLHGSSLGVAVVVNFLLGGLMMLGIGLYAPCLILLTLLGMSPLAAFPIMMGSCALLMPVGGARFVRTGVGTYPWRNSRRSRGGLHRQIHAAVVAALAGVRSGGLRGAADAQIRARACSIRRYIDLILGIRRRAAARRRRHPTENRRRSREWCR